MPTTHRTRVLIIGAGPAGYTAAIYAARASLEPMLVAGLQPGGQLMITTEVENYPGFAAGDPGSVADGADGGPGRACRHAHRERHHHRRGFLPPRRSSCFGDSGDVYVADSVVIATGAQARWLGLPSERLLQGVGVSACATCDGFFFRGKRVAVIGGGNTAVEEALYLTHHAETCHADPSPRHAAGREDPATPAVRPPEDPRGLGQHGGGDHRRRQPGQRRRRCGCATSAPGPRAGSTWTACSSPSATPRTTAPFRGQVALDDEGYVLTEPGTTRTSVAGVFAAGDVQDKVWRQAVTAAGTGCMAALEAEKWLADMGRVGAESATFAARD